MDHMFYCDISVNSIDIVVIILHHLGYLLRLCTEKKGSSVKADRTYYLI